jgi:hypothetical protein
MEWLLCHMLLHTRGIEKVPNLSNQKVKFNDIKQTFKYNPDNRSYQESSI